LFAFLIELIHAKILTDAGIEIFESGKYPKILAAHSFSQLNRHLDHSVFHVGYSLKSHSGSQK